MDLMPTLLELIGEAAPEGLQGRSFASLLRGEPSRFEPRPLISSAEINVSVRSRGWKLLESQLGPRRVLYDLASDPDERHDVLARHPEQAAALARAFSEHRAFCQARSESGPATAQPAGRRQPAWLINRDEIEDKLRALGYLE